MGAEKSLSLAMAQRVVDAAQKKAAEIGVPMSVAILDTAGRVVLHSTQDNTVPLAIEIARAKARTVVLTRMSTMDFYNFVKEHPHLEETIKDQGLCMIGGGYPIMVGGEMVGAIGVSGGLYLQDMECAEAGLEALK